jgi:cohesin loading factor subunit SCC2
MQVHGESNFYPMLPGGANNLQVSSLNDVKSINQSDNNAAKAISLDHLGVIAARIRSSVLNHRPGPDTANGHGCLSSMDEVK